MFVWLLLQCVAMFLGSFLAGSIPMNMTSFEENKAINIFGSGLLVGAALIVIIPEGVQVLYEVEMFYRQQQEKDISNHGPIILDRLKRRQGKVEERFSLSFPQITDASAIVPMLSARGLIPSGTSQKAEDDSHIPQYPQITSEVPSHGINEQGHSHNHASLLSTPPVPKGGFTAHSWVGVTLAAGFAFMLLVEHVSHIGHSHKKELIQVSELSSLRDSKPKEGNGATVIGLIVHAAADGVALGAASISSAASLGLIVFIAIMLHKAPSAFGLSTFLLQQGYSKRDVRAYLLAFSAAAPIASVLTYLLLVPGGRVENPAELQKWTGVLLLFSAGTFLFVATCHILPQVFSKQHQQADKNVGTSTSAGHHAGISNFHVFILLLGIFSPALLSSFH